MYLVVNMTMTTQNSKSVGSPQTERVEGVKIKLLSSKRAQVERAAEEVCRVFDVAWISNLISNEEDGTFHMFLLTSGRIVKEAL